MNEHDRPTCWIIAESALDPSAEGDWLEGGVDLENRGGSRLAIDDEVVPITSGTGETTFALSELARHAGSGRLVWRDLAYDHVRFHAQLQV